MISILKRFYKPGIKGISIVTYFMFISFKNFFNDFHSLKLIFEEENYSSEDDKFVFIKIAKISQHTVLLQLQV